MYLPDPFKEKDASFVGEFIDHHALATVVVRAKDAVIVDHIPFMRAADITIGATLIAHAAKSNSMWKALEDGAESILVFSGAGAYVSPSFYQSKARTHEVVPTWNYVAVHLHGTLQCTHDEAAKHAIVDALTNRMEAGRSVPWKIGDAPEAYIKKMLAGIVGLTFTVSEIVAKTKASQNRLPEDRRGVVEGLAADPMTREAAALVEHRLQGQRTS